MKHLERDAIDRVVEKLENAMDELRGIMADVQDRIPAPGVNDARREARREEVSVIDAALESLGDAIDLLEPLGWLGGPPDGGEDHD